ncbi:hypothetical protein [Qaidamihabitans albus]|uniref:hypothetical protein n=1 Tax=Qaidamihabitans albus TaxID=2795733 RepID=UPI0018F1B5FD|nr:hypothetical protein [Qaidamihabitans albus]
MSGIELSAPGMSTDDLYATSDRYFVAVTNLGKLVDRVAQWVTESTTDEERAHLWDQYSGLCRDYTVLMSWYQVCFAAAVFSETGSELKTVTVDGLQFTGAILTDR